MNKCIDCKCCNDCAFVHDGNIIAGLTVDEENRVLHCINFERDYVKLNNEQLIRALCVSRSFYFTRLRRDPDLILKILKRNGYNVRYEFIHTKNKHFVWYIKRAE